MAGFGSHGSSRIVARGDGRYDSRMSTTLLSWNVNGLRAVHRKGEFPAILSATTPDILCIQETKSHPDQLTKALLEVEGYEAHFASAERKGYSGVGVYSRATPKDVSTTFGPDGRWDDEGARAATGLRRVSSL